jgi:hypothetical protein
MATTVQAAVDEVIWAAAELRPPFDGLVALSKLPLQPEAEAGVAAAARDFGRRLELLRAARAALEALLADGYPDLPLRIVSAAAFAELEDDVQRIAAAFAKFTAARAAALNLSAGPAVPK